MIRSPMFSYVFAIILFVAGALCLYAALRGGILIGLVGCALDWLAGSLLLYKVSRRASVG